MSGEEPEGQGKADREETSQRAEDMELLQARLEEAERERSQFRELLQRVQADSINFKRRVEEEREEVQQRANADLVLKLLPVLDDYERALQHAPDVDSIKPWVTGVEMVYHKLRDTLESFGVTRIQALGQGFDPFEHEAVLHQATDEHAEGRVVSLVREGYKLHGRVLRPAQVVVSKRKEEESAEEGAPDSLGKETE